MYPNPQGCAQFLNRVGGGGSPPSLTPHSHHPSAMIKAAQTINNNYPSTPAMASPFFMDNLLHHQKAAAAVNFQSQFVNSQLHNYIQEQHHQFLVHQNQIRQQHAAKYASQEQLKQSSDSKISDRQIGNYSRNNSPLSEEGSLRNDYEDEEENYGEDSEKGCFRRPNKDIDDFKNRKRPISNTSPSIKENNISYEDGPEPMDDNSHSPIDDQDRFTEDSPSGSPINARLQSTVKNEYQLSPTNYTNNYYSDSYQKKENHSEETLRSNRHYGKDEHQDDVEPHINDSDQEIGRGIRKEVKLTSPCSNCGSFECNPFYPTCRNLRRYDNVDRIYARHEDRSDVKNIGNSGNSDISYGDANTVDDAKDVSNENRDKDGVVKRCGTNLDSGPAQKPVLKFSVSAILGQDTGPPSDRNATANVVKMSHHDGFPGQPAGPGGVFALPLGSFSLAPIAKPIASRPPPYPPGAVAAPHPHHSLHSLLAHCRHHPYLAVGGVAGGGGGWGAAVGGGGFPWAGARGKPRRGMMRRAVFSDTQRRGLERRFQLQKYISKPDRKKLAEKLGLKDSQVKIWFQNRRMKWRNSKERELLASGGSREQTLPNKNNPHPDLSDAETDRPKLSPLSPQSACENDAPAGNEVDTTSKTQFDQMSHHEDANYRTYMSTEGGISNASGYMMGSNGVRNNGGKSYSLMAADDAMIEDYDSDNGSNSDEEINVT